ncbi:MAG: DUF192 domain-containing protein [Vicinamibacterales bacterium]
MLSIAGRWGLRIEGSGTWLATDAELAGTSAARRRGLAGRESMAPGGALVIAPTQGIHTFGMRFALDLVAVARDGRVVRVAAGIRPRRVVFAWRAFAMVELPAGAAALAGVRPGDRLTAYESERMVSR